MPGILISPNEEDHSYLGNVFASLRRKLYAAESCREGVRLIGKFEMDVVICERDLPDGSWEDVIAAAAASSAPVIVAARHPDDRLWVEVLDRGGWDVLARPFKAREVVPALSKCWSGRKARAAGCSLGNKPHLPRPAAPLISRA